MKTNKTTPTTTAKLKQSKGCKIELNIGERLVNKHHVKLDAISFSKYHVNCQLICSSLLFIPPVRVLLLFYVLTMDDTHNFSIGKINWFA